MKRFATIVVRELREAAPAALFFLVAFHMIAVTKAVILADYHVDATRSALATVAALIVAKAILIAEKLPIARWFSRRLLVAVLWKTLLFGVIATTFRILEEILPLLVTHEGPVTAMRQAFGQMSWAHFWVVQMWLLALLFLYCLNAELVRVIGPANVRAMLLVPRPREEPTPLGRGPDQSSRSDDAWRNARLGEP
jgi:hypothetical protein